MVAVEGASIEDKVNSFPYLDLDPFVKDFVEYVAKNYDEKIFDRFAFEFVPPDKKDGPSVEGQLWYVLRRAQHSFRNDPRKVYALAEDAGLKVVNPQMLKREEIWQSSKFIVARGKTKKRKFRDDYELMSTPLVIDYGHTLGIAYAREPNDHDAPGQDTIIDHKYIPEDNRDLLRTLRAMKIAEALYDPYTKGGHKETWLSQSWKASKLEEYDPEIKYNSGQKLDSQYDSLSTEIAEIRESIPEKLIEAMSILNENDAFFNLANLPRGHSSALDEWLDAEGSRLKKLPNGIDVSPDSAHRMIRSCQCGGKFLDVFYMFASPAQVTSKVYGDRIRGPSTYVLEGASEDGRSFSLKAKRHPPRKSYWPGWWSVELSVDVAGRKSIFPSLFGTRYDLCLQLPKKEYKSWAISAKPQLVPLADAIKNYIWNSYLHLGRFDSKIIA